MSIHLQSDWYVLLEKARTTVSEITDQYAEMSSLNKAVLPSFNSVILRFMETDLQLVAAESDVVDLWNSIRESQFGFEYFTEVSRACREILGIDQSAVASYFSNLFAVHLPPDMKKVKSSIPDSDLIRLTTHEEAEAMILANPWLVPIYVVQTSRRFREMALEVHRAMGGAKRDEGDRT